MGASQCLSQYSELDKLTDSLFSIDIAWLHYFKLLNYVVYSGERPIRTNIAKPWSQLLVEWASSRKESDIKYLTWPRKEALMRIRDFFTSTYAVLTGTPLGAYVPDKIIEDLSKKTFPGLARLINEEMHKLETPQSREILAQLQTIPLDNITPCMAFSKFSLIFAGIGVIK